MKNFIHIYNQPCVQLKKIAETLKNKGFQQFNVYQYSVGYSHLSPKREYQHFVKCSFDVPEVQIGTRSPPFTDRGTGVQPL